MQITADEQQNRSSRRAKTQDQLRIATESYPKHVVQAHSAIGRAGEEHVAVERRADDAVDGARVRLERHAHGLRSRGQSGEGAMSADHHCDLPMLCYLRIHAFGIGPRCVDVLHVDRVDFVDFRVALHCALHILPARLHAIRAGNRGNGSSAQRAENQTRRKQARNLPGIRFADFDHAEGLEEPVELAKLVHHAPFASHGRLGSSAA